MARENQRPDATPTRHAPTSVDPRSVLRTPGSQARGLPRQTGLSASGRKIIPLAATPHARAAFRAINSRRATIFTPHRARRKSVREHIILVLAPGDDSKRLDSNTGNDTTLSGLNIDEDDDDDDEEDLPKRPRLSLPIDEEDDDDSDESLQPHRSVVFDDNDNFTMQSIEMPRRALSEHAGGRLSMGSVRMSDYFNTNDMLHSDDVEVDSGFFPPTAMLGEGDITMGVEELASPERLDSDIDRRDLGRESDFGIEIPLGEINESTFEMAPQVQESPERPLVEDDQPIYEDYAPLMDQRSDDFDDEDLLGDVPDLEEEPVEPSHLEQHEETEASVVTARRVEVKSSKKRIKVSKHGIEYPSLPPAVVKRLAQTFAKASGAKGKITPDAMAAIMQASDWFFEQLGEDLQAYAKHAGRKTIDESDVLTLMKRQRQINPNTTPFALAQRHLPRELLQELRMPPPAPPKKRRRTEGGAEDEGIT